MLAFLHEPIQFVTFTIGEDGTVSPSWLCGKSRAEAKITPLPRQPDYVRGVLNLRGAIVPIVDLRCQFGQGATSATSIHIVIILQIGTKPVGRRRLRGAATVAVAGN